MEQIYNKLRSDLFDLRMKQALQKKASSTEDIIETEQEILKIKQEIAETIKEMKIKGGDKNDKYKGR